MTKLLITGGCSFSECISTHIDTWPRHLARSLPKYTHIPTGLGSQGNGLISRKIIYEVSTALSIGISPNDILVCIMWSGIDRYDTYFQLADPTYTKNHDKWMENPTKVVASNALKQWYIFNPHWETSLNVSYYKQFYDPVMASIQTLEHILRVQWFLKCQGIKYMMTTYTENVFVKVNHSECKHLYAMVDRSHFLDIAGEYEWCKENGSYPFPKKNDYHPGTEQHGEFTEKVILPFLKEKGYIG